MTRPALPGPLVRTSVVAAYLGISPATVRRWAQPVETGGYGIGEQMLSGRQWRISYPLAHALAEWNAEAFKAMKAGDRESETVRRYLNCDTRT